MSNIEWTDETWNPTAGCSRVSPGCENCYAERQAIRMAGPKKKYQGLVRSGPKGPRWTGVVRLDRAALDIPLHWRKPRRIFVDSMSDLFHAELTDLEIAEVFAVMVVQAQHTFQVLTKRSGRMRALMNDQAFADLVHGLLLSAFPPFTWPPPNVMLGVSVESDDYVTRLLDLANTTAARRFVSMEPLLSEPKQILDWIYGLDWVIVGGESGPKARVCDQTWIAAVVDRCKEMRTPCFVKQLGDRSQTVLVDASGKLSTHVPVTPRYSKGGNPVEWPERLRVRQWPDKEPFWSSEGKRRR
jgi:protein gp37